MLKDCVNVIIYLDGYYRSLSRELFRGDLEKRHLFMPVAFSLSGGSDGIYLSSSESEYAAGFPELSKQ